MTGTNARRMLLALGLALACAPLTPAQTTTTTPSGDPISQYADRAAAVSPQRATLLRMNRKITLKVENTRLEDVVKFMQDVTQADLEPLWLDSSSTGSGLDKEKQITLNMQNQPALYVLEAVLDKAKGSDYAENSWQMTPSGAMQIGPKELLNKSKRVVIYDINDLLLVIPRYTEVPQIDLNNVLQSSQGGSSGSPFTNANTNNNNDTGPDRDERAKKVVDLLTQLVEPSQWQDNGGEGASVHIFNGTLIINAPDYIHRQINGYPYWPSGTKQVAANGKQRRYVTLNLDPGISTIDKIRQVPVTAVTGGGGGTGTGTTPGGSGGTGGGGSTTPGGQP